ncbi:hypothetical protein [Metapseudomonas furukawaii]|jgi:hypothetical protein|uniref:Uncharacterized protein n=1 Tax=Metapseudomonas furukawaii TaxID=1149133 RepID=A0AAD1FHR3_METFU|nr:hypothetical protein [Pseudomonas furukawaii]ELS29324.1 hypothetical protein ppKF707_0149 [Pseudomonas furukawaii]BAU76512.1 hypothetical protein KF707C_48240 [Pseudomonas furukawaii]
MGWIIGFLRTLFPRLFSGLGRFLLGFFGPLIAPVMGFIAQFFKKVGILLLVIAAIGTAVQVMALAIGVLLSQIANLGPPWMLEIGRMFVPGNLSLCITLLVLAKIKSLIFYWVTRLSEQFIHT